MLANRGGCIINHLQTGALKIVKTSEDGKISGIEFHVTGTALTGQSYDQTFTTDEKGEIFIASIFTLLQILIFIYPTSSIILLPLFLPFDIPPVHTHKVFIAMSNHYFRRSRIHNGQGGIRCHRPGKLHFFTY